MNSLSLRRDIRYLFKWTMRGAMAKLGSRLNGIQEAVGSSPTSSTIINLSIRVVPREFTLVPVKGGEFFVYIIMLLMQQGGYYGE